MSLKVKKRKAAKSLSTLFDKAALQELSSQPETANERMQRFFTSISPIYKQPSEFESKKVKLRYRLSNSVHQTQMGHTNHSENETKTSLLQSTVLPKLTPLKNPQLFTEGKQQEKSLLLHLNVDSSRTPSEQTSHNIAQNSPINSNFSPTGDIDSTISHTGDLIMQTTKNATVSNVIGAEFPNDKIPNFKFLHAQVNLLTQPLLFGGIVQYRFETKSKDSLVTKKIPESVLHKAIKLYNKKLLRYHHERGERAENLHMRALQSLNSIQDARDEVLSPAYWNKASSNCEFNCPDDLPPSMNLSKPQYNKFQKFKEEIDKLQSERRKKVYILKSLTELTKEVDRLKKADDKFLLEKSHPTTARLYANKLVQTVNNGMQKRITYDVKQFQTRKLQNLIDKLIGFMKKKII